MRATHTSHGGSTAKQMFVETIMVSGLWKMEVLPLQPGLHRRGRDSVLSIQVSLPETAHLCHSFIGLRNNLTGKYENKLV
jgi:hypothetical protein